MGLVWQRGYHDRVIRRGDLRRPESGSGGTLPTIRSSGSEGGRRGIIVSSLVCHGANAGRPYHGWTGGDEDGWRGQHL